MMRARWQGSCLWAAAMVVLSAGIHAQSAGTVTPEDEYKKLIRVSEDVQPLGSHPFGENISLYAGSLSFTQIDVSQPGDGPLLTLARQYVVQDAVEAKLGGPHAFGNWRLVVPHLETLTAGNFSTDPTGKSSGWLVNAIDQKARCSEFDAPPDWVMRKGDPALTPWVPDSWWKGYHLVLPGEGEQDLLHNADPAAAATYPVVTKGHWRFSCLSSTANNMPGEGFLGQAPDGTKYWFDELVYRDASLMSRPLYQDGVAVRRRAKAILSPPQDKIAMWLGWMTGSGAAQAAPDSNVLPRDTGLLLVTKVQDSFGKTLHYSYDAGGNLTGIVADDGRVLSVTYVSGTTRIQRITLQPASGSPRTWAYAYNSDGTSLVGVTLPNGSRWQYDFAQLDAARLAGAGQGSCITLGTPSNLSSRVGIITHPSGLVGQFTVQPIKRGRSYVDRDCRGAQNGYQDYPGSYALIPNAWYNLALTKVVYSGAGLGDQPWIYRYSPANESWHDCSGNCQTTVWSDVVAPDGSVVRRIFSNRYDVSESQLLRTEYYAGEVGASALLRAEDNKYTTLNTAPIPLAGYSSQQNVNFYQVQNYLPMNYREIHQDGDTYTWEAESFNAYAQVTKARRSSSVTPGPSMIEETTSYLNDTSLWVLGLQLTVTNVTNAGAPEVESSNTYNTMGQLVSRARFGQVLMNYTWYPAGAQAAGQLASFTDGNNHTTTLGSYKRGIPQAIGYPDGKSQSLVVDDFGQINSITDQTGATTSYNYDAVGQLKGITYPAGDEQAWLPKTFAYDYVLGAERGLGGGHWRRTVSIGNARTVSYFDAKLRPVLSDRFISGVAGSNATTLTNYDAKGQAVFASYPNATALNFTAVRDPVNSPGTTSSYDALGRLIQVRQDSELGVLSTGTAYLSGARVQATDPNGNVTVTSHQVFDQPSYDVVIQVQAPAGLNQTIARSLYGEPLSIRQYGSDQGLAGDITRWYVYDNYHRLCRTVEPESGSAVTAYDGANNVAWTAEGQSIAGTTDCGQAQVAAGARTVRTYDAMNRVKTIQPPANTPSTTYDYDAAGRMVSAITDGIALKSMWGGAYNRRGALISESLQLTGLAAWSIGYTHDAYGNVSSMRYPDGQNIDFAPDALGRPTRVGDYATGIGYFPNGDVQQLFYGNDTVYLAEQNKRQLLSNFSYGQSTPALSEDYSYDVNGNLTAVNDLAGGPRSKTMGYDALNRLTSAAAPNLYGTESYTYDPLNNLRSRVTGGQAQTYNYDASNLLASITRGGSPVASYGYDARGNQTLRNGATHLFDAKNQLTQIENVGSYAYDAAGRRVVKTPANGGASTYYFYSQAGQLMYQVESGKALTTSFAYLGRKLVGSNEELVLTAPATVGFDANPNNGSYTATWGGVPGATSYMLQESVNGGGWSTIYSGGATSQGLSGKAGGNYTYRVEACAGATCGGWATSDVLGVRPALPVVTVPTGTINGTYTVSWTAPTGATDYDVQERLNGGSWITIASHTTATVISRPGTTSGSHTYQVSANNAYGSRGWASSAAVTVDTTYGVVPAVPTGLSVPAASYNGSAAIGWNAANLASRYVLQQSINGGNWATVYDSGATGTTLSGLANGGYTYQLQACNQYGCSAWVNGGPLVVTLPPATAPNVSVPGNSNSGSYAVSWNAVATAASYILQESINGGGWITVQANGNTSWSANGRGNGSYGYRVQACNGGGCGSWSGTGTTNVLLAPDSAPSLSVPGSSTTGSYTVSWGWVATAAGYTLQESVNNGGWITVQANGNTSWSASGRGDGSYGYRVQACNGGGCGPWSGVGTVNVALVPGEPQGISLTEQVNGRKESWILSWAAVSHAGRYEIVRVETGTTIYSGTELTFVLEIGPIPYPALNYSYKLRACNAAGCSAWALVP